jgi:phage-related protein
MTKNLTSDQLAEIEGSMLITKTLVTLNLDSGPFRILANDSVATMVIDSDTYYTSFVQMSPIQTSLDGTTDSMIISISNVAQAFSGLVATDGDVLTNRECTVQEAIFDATTGLIVDTPVLLFDGVINRVQMTAKSFVFTVERILNNYSALSPKMIFDVNCQWKFKDSRCTYSGSETKCDKTLTTCQSYSNVTNFGGYPSVVLPIPTS